MRLFYRFLYICLSVIILESIVFYFVLHEDTSPIVEVNKAMATTEKKALQEFNVEFKDTESRLSKINVITTNPKEVYLIRKQDPNDFEYTIKLKLLTKNTAPKESLLKKLRPLDSMKSRILNYDVTAFLCNDPMDSLPCVDAIFVFIPADSSLKVYLNNTPFNSDFAPDILDF